MVIKKIKRSDKFKTDYKKLIRKSPALKIEIEDIAP